MPTPVPIPAVAQFARRTQRAAALGALVRGLAITSAGGAASLLVLRGFGCVPEPTAWWLLALLPLLASCWRAAALARLSPAVAAAYLDQRLHLHGLLLAAQGGAWLDAAFAQQLARGLANAKQVRPRLQWQRAALASGVAVALLLVVLALPRPVPPPAASSTKLVELQLAQTAQALRDLFARGQVPAEVQQELQNRLGELQAMLDAGVVSWRDLDALEERLQREAALQELAEVAQNGRAQSPLRQGNGGKPGGLSDSQLQELAKAALAALDLPLQLSELQSAMKAAQLPDGGFDFSGLHLDPAALAQLRQLAEQFAEREFGREAVALGEGEEGADSGQGGVERGPGIAPLHLDGEALGGANQDLKLPPGAPLPGEWTPVGSRLLPAQTAPQANAQPGGASSAGSSGSTWQLNLAPRHRQVVRRFFGEELR